MATGRGPMTSTPSMKTPVRSNLFSRAGGAEGLRKREGQAKRPFRVSPDIDKVCARCSNELDKKDDVLRCAGCKLYFCYRCCDVSKQAIKLILNGELEDYIWNCKSCKTTAPTLESINQAINEMSIRQEERLTILENRMERMEAHSIERIETKMKTVKEDIVVDIHEEVTKLVDNRTRELEDRKRRELNLVVFNLPEADLPSGQECKQKDEEAFQEIAAAIGVEEVKIEVSYRLGKKNEGKDRVLKIILQDRKERKKILENVKHIKEKVISEYTKVIISKDLTEQQRREKREKRMVKQSQNRVKRQPSADDYMEVTLVDGDRDIDSFNRERQIMEMSQLNVILEEDEHDVTVQGGILQGSGLMRDDSVVRNKTFNFQLDKSAEQRNASMDTALLHTSRVGNKF